MSGAGWGLLRKSRPSHLGQQRRVSSCLRRSLNSIYSSDPEEGSIPLLGEHLEEVASRREAVTREKELWPGTTPRLPPSTTQGKGPTRDKGSAGGCASAAACGSGSSAGEPQGVQLWQAEHSDTHSSAPCSCHPVSVCEEPATFTLWEETLSPDGYTPSYLSGQWNL